MYTSLIGTPIQRIFPEIPFHSAYTNARRVIGVLTFYFALLHTLIAFFGELGGFEGLTFLAPRYLFAISSSFIALCMLCFLTLTSVDMIKDRIIKRGWTFLFNLIYLVGVLVLLHAAILGTHFTMFSKTLPFIILSFLFIFFLLESFRFELFIRNKYSSFPKYLIIVYCLCNLLAITSYIVFVKQPLSIHGGLGATAMPGIPMNNGLTVPQNPKKYLLSLRVLGKKISGKQLTIQFTIFDTETKKNITLFSTPYEKPFHLVIVNYDLTYFTHIHPVVDGDSLVIQTSFPKTGRYMLYTDFIPFNGVEQQFPFSVDIGEHVALSQSTSLPDTTLTKAVGSYYVSLKNKLPLSAKKLENQEEQVHLNITDANKNPFANLYPYLNAFGHMIMVNQKTMEYVHVHPTVLVSKQNFKGGPDIYFMPMSLKGPITPGIYRIFTELNPNGKLILSEFTVEITP